MLVAAGPGSGKTYVVTQRILRLIVNAHVPPDNILVITFTNAAAAEMKRRFARLAGENPVRFGTFHAVFYHILRETLSPRKIQLISEEETKKYIAGILRSAPFLTKERTESAESILRELLRMESSGKEPENYIPLLADRDIFFYTCRELEQKKRREGRVGFQDIIKQCRELLLKNPAALKTWRERFSYILVDEFQDIDALQYDTLKLLAGERANLFMVGDDDQSIYGFRGARPDMMRRVRGDFPGLEQVVLGINYRSGEEIVKAAGRVIAENRNRIPKQLRAKKPGGTVRIRIYEDGAEENAALAEELKAADEPTQNSTAVIFRTNRELSEFAGQLVLCGVPFIMREKCASPFRTPEALDILACLKFASGERTRENFYRFMNKPFRGIGREEVPSGPVNAVDLRRSGDMRRRETVDRLFSDLARLGTLPPFAAVCYIRLGMGYERYMEEKYEGEALEEKRRLLLRLTKSARNMRTLREWESFIAVYERKLQDAVWKEKPKKGVSLVTMHGSKGLEYDRVYLPHLNEGKVPYKKSVSPEEIEEERRMLYVAMTRAKKELLLSCAEGEREKLSRFLLPLMKKGRSSIRIEKER